MNEDFTQVQDVDGKPIYVRNDLILDFIKKFHVINTGQSVLFRTPEGDKAFVIDKHIKEVMPILGSNDPYQVADIIKEIAKAEQTTVYKLLVP